MIRQGAKNDKSDKMMVLNNIKRLLSIFKALLKREEREKDLERERKMLRGGADEVGMWKIKGVEVWFLRGSVSQGRGVGGAVGVGYG